ncbi:MAG: hypothetical protein P1U34_04430 [Coxiellaceae bacterium]|nr:hypothetical protein [Coxiellaceae bacterium]
MMKAVIGIACAVLFSIAVISCQKAVTPAQVQTTSQAASAAAGPSEGV